MSDHGIQGPARHERVERIHGRRRSIEQEGALAEVVENQRRQHHGEPGEPDRALAEMAHIGVQSLAAGHDQHDRAQDEKAPQAIAEEEIDRMPRIDGGQHLRMAQNSVHAQYGDRREPDHHDPPEHRAHPGGAMPLEHEQRHQNDTGHDRHYPRRHLRRRDADALDRAEDRDRRGDDPVAVEQCRAEQADARQQREHPAAPAARPQQRQQGHDAALAPVIGRHDEGEVLERHDEVERPEDERQHSQHVGRGGREAVFRREALLERVEGAGADVAVDHAQRAEGRGRKGAAAARGPMRRSLWRHGGTGIRDRCHQLELNLGAQLHDPVRGQVEERGSRLRVPGHHNE